LQEGFKGLTVGWVPTLIGYSLQGFGKFGFYEIFKDVYKGIVGKENADKYKTIGWSVSSACAEVIADTLLCPFEAVKVRMQTDPSGKFPRDFGTAWETVMKNEGWNGFYRGLVPLWCRQVPYTVVKFVAFEKTVRWMYRVPFAAKPQKEYSKATQLMITFLSGYWAGIFCAIVSHPADTMVSKINNMKGPESMGTKVGMIYKEIGFNGLWRGLTTRIFMIGTLTGL